MVQKQGLYFDKEVPPGIYNYDADVQEKLRQYTEMYLRAFRFFYAPIYGIRQPCACPRKCISVPPRRENL